MSGLQSRIEQVLREHHFHASSFEGPVCCCGTKVPAEDWEGHLAAVVSAVTGDLLDFPEMRIAMTSFGLWLTRLGLLDADGSEVELVDQFLEETLWAGEQWRGKLREQ